jgi:catalase
MHPGAGVDPRRFLLLMRQTRPTHKAIRQRQIDNCTKADPTYGFGVAEALERLTPLG